MQLIQNWLPYNETILFNFSDKYFKESGKAVFSNEGKSHKHVVPNGMTNSKAHARSFAKFISDNLDNYPQDQKIKILEVGSGAGVYARNFLLCAREMNFLDRIEYLVTEYSRVGLQQIKESKVLSEFQENVNYRFVYLDILNPDLAEDIDGKPYKLENLSATILNYILCVLPATVVRKSKNGNIQQLLMRFKEPTDNKEDLGYLESLLYEENWKGYFIENEPEIEKKYFDILKQSLDIDTGCTFEFYAYGSLLALENVLNRSNENAFVFIAEMPRIKATKRPFKAYGHSIANPINQGLISSFVKSKNLDLIYSTDPHYPLTRMFILKNPGLKEQFKTRFTQEYIENNDSNLILELRNMAQQFKSKHSCLMMKKLLDKLLEIDSTSFESNLLLANYFYLSGDFEQARSLFHKARELDYLNNIRGNVLLEKKFLEVQHESAR